MENDYEPYGKDWEKEMKNFKKDDLIFMLKNSFMECASLKKEIELLVTIPDNLKKGKIMDILTLTKEERKKLTNFLGECWNSGSYNKNEVAELSEKEMRLFDNPSDWYVVFKRVVEIIKEVNKP